MSENYATHARHALHQLIVPIRHFKLSPALSLLCLAPLLLAGCRDAEPQHNVPPRPVRYVTAPQPSAGIPSVRIGEIRAHDEISLGFRLDGRMLSRQADVGQRVTKGQVLAALESDTGRNQLSSARAELDSARAAERVAALTLNRMKSLMPSGAIARVQLDTATSDWQSAVSRRQSSEAALKNAQDNLAWTQLTAPQSGVITQVSASAGQVVSAGQAVFTLAANNGRDAVFDVADPQALDRNRSGRFTISLLSEPSVQVTGLLRDISPQADAQTRTWRVRIALDNPPEAMALGASVQGEMPLSGPGMIAIPASALTQTGDSAAVFVVDNSRQLHLRPVSPGKYTASTVFISRGVQPGEKVVTAGVSKLREGETVTLGEEAK
ncbi:efflux RND transporter periplasmic adaptor subunit [Affinibrenneria salicis]|uniref:Efflux RND transporter periplasmic adaptor subunit n=1 Tax=Affinibrenneria salicis TaxID=2590031 RepID=A0A5J5FS99_9GAMM|nr:efflux RND transporter periplasmic adaptor subunit [Affinibrenneria salicis]KAA8995759.1 efflux RND transporter periplasmic adaptor subunit [Affinibrenneria salicis]